MPIFANHVSAKSRYLRYLELSAALCRSSFDFCVLGANPSAITPKSFWTVFSLPACSTTLGASSRTASGRETIVCPETSMAAVAEESPPRLCCKSAYTPSAGASGCNCWSIGWMAEKIGTHAPPVIIPRKAPRKMSFR